MTNPKDMEDRPTGREDMIERVARALYVRRPVHCGPFPIPWEQCDTTLLISYCADARAAIDAVLRTAHREGDAFVVPRWFIACVLSLLEGGSDLSSPVSPENYEEDLTNSIRKCREYLGLAQRTSGESK